MLTAVASSAGSVVALGEVVSSVERCGRELCWRVPQPGVMNTQVADDLGVARDTVDR